MELQRLRTFEKFVARKLYKFLTSSEIDNDSSIAKTPFFYWFAGTAQHCSNIRLVGAYINQRSIWLFPFAFSQYRLTAR